MKGGEKNVTWDTGEAKRDISHHGHLQSIDVEGADLPIAADVVYEFDKSVEPEDSGDD